MRRGIRGYRLFKSTNPRFDFSFLYPESWQVREIEEKEYSQVFILGPRNKDNKYSPALIVSVVRSREKGGSFNTVEELVADHLHKSRSFSNFREIFKARGNLASFEAMEFAISHTAPLPINTVNAKDTVIMERRIVIKREGCFYELDYRGVEEDYHAFFEAFKQAAKTFEFQPDRVTETQAYRPLVTPVPLALREEPPAYDTEPPKTGNLRDG